jgi:predicted ABC-type ATPase
VIVESNNPAQLNVKDSCIYVIAGPNGAGKSSIIGDVISRRGVRTFNPDAAAKQVRSADPSLSTEESNSVAWHEGVRLLRQAIDDRLDFAFETTLGGHTITGLLESAAAAGIDLRIWYVALDSAELHIQRVKSRVERGGHDIPVDAIRARYDQSRLNLIRLLPVLRELWLYDNSVDSDPIAGLDPKPRLIVQVASRKVVATCELSETPDWAKPILAECFRISRQHY